MIHDAVVEVTCDGDRRSCEYVPLRAGSRHTYIASDSEIEKALKSMGWICRDGMHFCCEECADKDQQ